MMSDSVVVSIDSSTTACKAIAWDRKGHALAEGRSAYPMLRPQPGWAEQDAQEWWRCACSAVRECVNQLSSRQIEALGITHQRESFVPVDAAGIPLRNAILWLDERSRTQLAWLEEHFGADSLHELTGKPPSMTQSLPKIVWLLQNEPEIAHRAYKILDVHAFLNLRLTGEWRTSLASADPMALIDMKFGKWAEELIDELGLRVDQFVDVVAPGEIVGYVTEEAARLSGLPTGLPVIAGGGDGQCAGVGVNALGGGRAYLNMGTAIASGVLSRRYIADRAFRTLCAPIHNTFFLEHTLRGGVFTVAWFVEKFAADLQADPLTSAEQLLESEASAVVPGSRGLVLVPYWNGVMNPYWDPAASGITIGWTGEHSRAHLYRAILEGVAYEQRLVGDAVMASTGETIREYVIMGGGSQSALWRQIMADVTGIPVVRSTATEATCLGAAIIAAAGIGWYANVQEAAQAMTGTGVRHKPEPSVHATYDEIYQEVYRPLYPTLQPLLQRLRDITDQ